MLIYNSSGEQRLRRRLEGPMSQLATIDRQ